MIYWPSGWSNNTVDEAVHELEEYCELMDAAGHTNVPLLIYDETLRDALIEKYDDFGSVSIRGHRMVYMERQDKPPRPRRKKSDTQAKKSRRTAWYKDATRASPLF